MDITASSVARKQFSKRQRGYDPKEVAAYLDSVGSVMAGYERDLNQLAAKIEKLQDQLVGARQAEEAVKLTIIAASQAKEEMLTKAQHEADRMVEAAVTDAAAVRADAETVEAQVKDMIANAHVRADDIIKAAEERYEARLAEAEVDAKQRVDVARREALALLDETRIDAESLINVAIEEESELQERLIAVRLALDLVEGPLRKVASGALDELGKLRELLPEPSTSSSSDAQLAGTAPSGPIPIIAEISPDPFAEAVDQQASLLVRRDFEIVGDRSPIFAENVLESVAVAPAQSSPTDAEDLMNLAYTPESDLTG